MASEVERSILANVSTGRFLLLAGRHARRRQRQMELNRIKLASKYDWILPNGNIGLYLIFQILSRRKRERC